jgi:anti-anti-sigma factor
MDAHPLTVKTVRDGPVCTLILRGDLDFLAADRFVEHAARVVDERTDRFVLDLAGLTFLDCAGVRALMTATSIAPSGCPVIIRSLSRPARRVIELLDLRLDNLREFSAPSPDSEDMHGGGAGDGVADLGEGDGGDRLALGQRQGLKAV